jgi:hypothetical protein
MTRARGAVEIGVEKKELTQRAQRGEYPLASVR